jgi:hypothetical protein
MVHVIFYRDFGGPAQEEAAHGPFRALQVVGRFLTALEGEDGDKAGLLLAELKDDLWHVPDGMEGQSPPYQSFLVVSENVL